MIKVVFVVRGITKGGVRRFLLNLLYEFEQLSDNNLDIHVIHNQEDFIGKYKNISDNYIATKSLLLFDLFYSLMILRREKPDYIIYPKNVIPFTHALLKSKKITVIHDLGYFEKTMKLYPLKDRIFMKLFVPFSCFISHKILAISDFTKFDIMKHLHIKESKIETIYEGVESNFRIIDNEKYLETIKNKFNICKPFIFYSGEISKRKNIMNMLNAYLSAGISEKYDLVITGGKVIGCKEEMEIIHITPTIKQLGYISDEDLAGLYNLADFFLFPSLYEGFGLPILEAQACGCPVIVSNVTSCPEIAGEGAILVDPISVDSIRNGILSLIKSEESKSIVRNKGLENILRFSWSKTISKMSELLQI